MSSCRRRSDTLLVYDGVSTRSIHAKGMDVALYFALALGCLRYRLTSCYNVTILVTIEQKYMSTNSRFAVAIHTLAFLAFLEQRQAEPVSSDVVAQSVNTNPVVIRRLLGTLRDAKLVTSQPGSGGGWRLMRSAGDISLCEIYAAVKEGPLFAQPPRSPDPHCMIGRHVQQALGGFLEAAEQTMQQSLAQVTVADVVHEITSVLSAGCAGQENVSVQDQHPFVLPVLRSS